MKSIIIGTAGHIDHGKTALVKALTGIDADRLEEEKRRGITIDLGFAHMELAAADGGTIRAGFVDVPGHERFVRNMLAGVGGIDLVLLVIAADESIKPQTREHFDILQLLGVRQGITVLTKSDLVDAETLDVVRLEVAEFLRGTFLEPPRAPIVPVSSLSGAGLKDLKREIIAAAGRVHARDAKSLARLPIDRVFTMKGFGTVATGTLVAGTLAPEQELEVFPAGKRVRVRGVQVHGQPAGSAVAGQRTALNLAGASVQDLSRGMALAPPDTFAATRLLDVHLRLLTSAPAPLKDRARVHFHAHTMETVGEIVLHRSPALNPHVLASSKAWQMLPGTEAFARIKLPEPTLLLPGDRFIIRRFSPVVTIGGGVVLDAAPMRGLKQDAVDQSLSTFLEAAPEQILVQRIARRRFQGLFLAQAVQETGWQGSVVEKHLERSLSANTVAKFGDLFFDAAAISALYELLPHALAEFHQQNPLVAGMARETLREKFGLRAEIFAAVLESLVRQNKVEASGDLLHLPGRGVVMKDEEAESKRAIEAAFATSGLKVPPLPEVLAGLRIDRVRAQKIVTLLLRDKTLVKISDDLVFHRGALESLRTLLAAQKARSSRMDVATFKELTGVSRKYAIPLLEYLDRERVTKRVGDAREIL